MSIYATIVQAYFIGMMKVETMEEIWKHDLLEYEHLTHEGPVRFARPIHAIYAIIQCENMAHKQAKRFKKPKFTFDKTA